MQATYTFPVGVTTLWWYAPSTSLQVQAASVNVTGEFDDYDYGHGEESGQFVVQTNDRPAQNGGKLRFVKDHH